MRFLFLLAVIVSGYASSHSLTPTYPSLELSYVPGVYKADLELFNARKDISYYEVGVFDAEWNAITAAITPKKIMKVPHSTSKKITVYIPAASKDRAVYICTKSKTLFTPVTQVTVILSKICSKLK
jgi:hypothetical protein|tara:strand:- start:357 stop:734 length:378 start_codon:yes stop_codon:yes gene_type:complete